MSVKSKGLRAAFERGMQILFLLCGILAVAFVLFISIYLIIAGLPAIREIGLKEFLFGTRWAPIYKADPAYGILPFILTSIYGTAGAVVIGVPVGVVHVVEAKEMLLKTGLPCIVARGRRGGSNVAAAIVNALLYGMEGVRA